MAQERRRSVGLPAPCILGIDLGTTSVKVALVEKTNKGPSLVASCTELVQADVPIKDPQLRENEQDVHGIIEALNSCLMTLSPAFTQRVCCIGVSGQMHGVMFWEAGKGGKWTESGSRWSFQPEKVSHLITWQDGRCSPKFLSSLPEPRSHLSVSSGYGCATVFWLLKNRPDFLAPYTAAGTIQDYVVAMLCGREKPQMSVQNAAAWGYFSSLDKSWNTTLLKDAGFPIHLLPEVVDSGDLAGETCQAWHRIAAGTKVGVALGDFQCSVYSCMSENSDAVLNVGTSAQLAVSMPPEFQPVESPDPNSPVQYFPYFDNRYLAVAASLNGGNVMATFVKMLVGWMAELGIEVSESTLYRPMIEAGLTFAETRLHICPTVFGERHAPTGLASVTAIAASEISLGQVIRALCRGVIRNLHSMLPSESLKDAGAKRIVASGSGLCRNEVMKQEVEAAFALPVVYGKVADAAVGAAYVMLKRNYGRTEPEGTSEVF
ncbi:sedoheptulokinase [Pantherophis guttatus]|uniref:Sedoheptulokinase n=1 Tax=Pantherophis guttatus TaxID=94885 RepID=A0A6P9B080_PANGU|nr:sedoheptulokinase [Pantherophis guttatus]XP_034262914.1 sedoheptulokinase [Pantherophis guttatus]XP_034262915.1 sedoheptulokinase [Pantherophis guttatus]